MMKLFMIDIESTGVNQTYDDIIEIGMVQMHKDDRGFYKPGGDVFHQILNTMKPPIGKFALENMVDLYSKAHQEPVRSYSVVRNRVTEWLVNQGSKGAKNTQFCGLNCSTFDLPFMVKKGYLIPSGYDNDNNQTGDFHYRPYEMSGLIEGLSDILGYSRKTIISLAKEEKSKPVIKMPEGKSHDAVYDCFKQIGTLNGLIALGRKVMMLNL